MSGKRHRNGKVRLSFRCYSAAMSSRTITALSVSILALLLGSSCKAKPDTSASVQTPVATSSALGQPKSTKAEGPLKSCAECESASACSELMNPCQKFTGDDAKKCEAVKECVQRTGCGQGEHTFTSCYCGELGTAKCLEAPLTGNGATSGACRDVIVASLGAPKNNTELLTRFIEAEYPGGAALGRLNCLKLNCQRECSFDKKGPVAPGVAAPK
jgi:hypothetical protein